MTEAGGILNGKGPPILPDRGAFGVALWLLGRLLRVSTTRSIGDRLRVL